MNESKTVVGLEIGTGKMQAFVGEIIDNKDLNIVGSGQASPMGVKKGEIVDIRKAAGQAQAAIMEAERKLNIKLRDVYVSISGMHVKGFRHIGTANISGADNIVRRDDIDRAKDDAKSKSISDDKAYIHKICCGYYLDGVAVMDPLGKVGNTIEAEYWLVYGDVERIRQTMDIVEGIGMEVKQIVLSGLASARIVTTPEQRARGVLAIDIGCGSTDYAYFRNGRLVQAGSIPIGGDHVTNDLSYGLQISINNANKLKLKVGGLVISDEERQEKIWIEGDKGIGDRSFLRESIHKIISLRFEELFEIVMEDMEEYFERGEIEEIVITGGVSKTSGIVEFGKEVFGVSVSIGRYSQWVKTSLCHPEFATGLGLLDCALNDYVKKARREESGIVGKIKRLFRK